MMHKCLVSLVLLSVLLASCSSALPFADWCYTFDFRNSNYGFVVHKGTWVPGSGFISAATGSEHFLTLTYVNVATVSPNAIIFSVARGSTTSVQTRVTVEAEVFGIASGVVTTEVPANVNTADIRMVGSGSTSYLVIDGRATAPARLLRMQVRGLGSNPLGATNCETDEVQADTELGIGLEMPDLIGTTLSQADADLASADVNLAAPDGSALLPSLDPLASTVFGYIKWIISGNAAGEIAGPFAPILTHLGIFVVMNFTLTSLGFIIYGAIYLIRWAVWLFKTVLAIIQTIATIISSIPGLVIVAVLVGIAGAVAAIVAFVRAVFGGG